MLAIGFALVTVGAWLLPLVGPESVRLSAVLTIANLGLGVSTMVLFLVPLESVPVGLTASAAALPLLCLEAVGAVAPVLAGAGADTFGGRFRSGWAVRRPCWPRWSFRSTGRRRHRGASCLRARRS